MSEASPAPPLGPASAPIPAGRWIALWRRLAPSQFARHIAVVIGGTALAQVITVGVSPVLTRLYSPSDFGILSVYVSVLGLVVVAASLRYETAIPLPASDEDAGNVLALAMLIVAASSILVAALAMVVGPRLLAGSRYAALAPYTWLLPVSMLGAGAYQVFAFWVMRKEAFKTLARTKISQSAGQAITQLVLGFLRVGPLGLLLGDVVGRVGGTGTLMTLAWREDRSLLKSVSWSGIKRMARRFQRFPLLSSGSALLNAATLQVPLLILAALYGPKVAGLFALGQRVLAAPMSLVGTAIANVYYSVLAGVARDDPKRIQPMFFNLTRRLALVGIGPVLIAGLFGPWLCQTVFGAQWREAGVFLQLSTPMLLVQFIASPLGGTLDVLERQDLHLIREVFRQSLSIGALLAAKIFAVDAWHAVLLFSIAGVFGNFFYIASTWYALRNEAVRGATTPSR